MFNGQGQHAGRVQSFFAVAGPISSAAKHGFNKTNPHKPVHARILVLDGATADVDVKTYTLIQMTYTFLGRGRSPKPRTKSKS